MQPVDALSVKEMIMTDSTNIFRLTSTQKGYLQKQLDTVSRSFAILIPYIETPLRHYLAVAYLLCRVADNIEDCGRPYPWKKARFEEFLRLLQEPQRAHEQLAAWDNQSWPGLSDDERQIMGVRRGLSLWQIYAMIPARVQIVVARWISVMATGMRQLGDPDGHPFFVKRKGIDVLESVVDYNEYCYYVAGTVGELASELVVQQYQLAPDLTATLHARATSCGRSLQKTNIIKDFVEDLSRGICYLPDTWLSSVEYSPLDLRGVALEWKALVITDVLDELRDAVDYVLALPHHAAGYRQASLLCLFPAYYTMLNAARHQETLFTSGHQVKISRTTIAECISDSRKVLFDDHAIRQYCSRIENTIYQLVGRPVMEPQP